MLNLSIPGVGNLNPQVYFGPPLLSGLYIISLVVATGFFATLFFSEMRNLASSNKRRKRAAYAAWSAKQFFRASRRNGVTAIYRLRATRWLSIPLTRLEWRIQRHLAHISKIGRNKRGSGWTRYAFSREETRAHAYAARILKRLGFEISIDVFGNLRARRTAGEGLPTYLLGTHLDTVPNGGNYDGVVGFIAAVEAIRLIEKDRLNLNLEVTIFRAEESTRFGKAVLGSRAAFGFLSQDDLDDLRDTLRFKGAATLRHALIDGGFKADLIGQSTLRADAYDGYFEVHIEQARLLERECGNSLGVVTAIRGPERRRAVVTGKGSLKAVAAMILAVEKIAEEHAGRGRDIVATIGRVEDYFNGADKINAIPGTISIPLLDAPASHELRGIEKVCAERGIRMRLVARGGPRLVFEGVTDHSGGTPMGRQHRKDGLVAAAAAIQRLSDSVLPEQEQVRFYMDIRSSSKMVRARVSREIIATWRTIESEQGVSLTVSRPIESTAPRTSLDSRLQARLAQTGVSLGINMIHLPSGAGHDAMIAAQAGIPTAMLFVPSIDGLSHNPKEWTPLVDIANAVRVLARTLESLSAEETANISEVERKISVIPDDEMALRTKRNIYASEI